MLGFVANTDIDWFKFLATRACEEVNFWQPSGSSEFRAVPAGAPFFFRLKMPHRKIAGFGFLSRHSILPDWLAWDTFGEANGAPDFETMRRRIEKYRKRFGPSDARDYRVGCLMILNPTFFPEHQWVDEPADFSQNIVRGKTYDLTSGEGKRVLDQCLAARTTVPGLVATPTARYGEPVLVRPRLGQCSFRIAVMEAYQSACAVTTEHSLPALDAAHIRPYADGGEHAISNGILLRSDIHRLFDKGYVTVTPAYRFEVGRRLKEDFENGKSYYGLRGQTVHLPVNPAERPDHEMLRWHNERRFLG